MLAHKLRAASSGKALPKFISSSVNRITATSNTVIAPSGIKDGDLLVAVVFTDTPGQAVTPHTGFNAICSDASLNSTVVIATKTASSESGNYTFTFNSSAKTSVAILVYRNATTVNTVGYVTKTASPTGTAASINPTYAGVLCCAFATMSASTVTTAPSGLTQLALSTGGSPGVGVYDLSGQSAAATSAYSIVWSGSASVASVQFQITNEPDVTPTFINSANTSNGNVSPLSIARPTGTMEGDLMVAIMACDANARTWSGDTNWTEVADQGADPDLRIAYKVAGSSLSDPGPYAFTLSGSQKTSGVILTYRDAAYDAIAGSFTTGASNLVLPSITTTSSQSILLAVGARSASGVVIDAITPMNSVFSDSDNNDPSYAVFSQTVANGPTGTRTLNVGSGTGAAGIMLSIKPTRSLT